jgi:hypothetical protein
VLQQHTIFLLRRLLFVAAADLVKGDSSSGIVDDPMHAAIDFQLQ